MVTRKHARHNKTPETASHSEIAQLKTAILSAIDTIRSEEKPTPPKKEKLILSVLQKVPVLASLLGQIKSGKKAIDSLAQLKQAQAVRLPPALEAIPAVSIPFTYIGLINTVFDFIKLPLVYVASLVLGQPSPVKLTALAQWLYSGVLLLLTITSLLIPPTAPIIGGTMIALGFGSSIYFWDQFKKEKRKLQPEIEVLTEEVTMLTEVISIQKLEIEKKINDIRQHMKRAKKEDLDLYLDTLINYQEILAVPEERLKTILQKKMQKTGELKSMNNLAELDKLVTVFLSTVAMGGLLFSLIVPPIGLVLVNTAVFSGCIYTLGRLIIPPIAPYMQKVFAHLHAVKENPTDSLPPTPSVTTTKSLEKDEKCYPSPILRKTQSHQVQDDINKKNELKP